jgi:hypothetical protein
MTAWHTCTALGTSSDAIAVRRKFEEEEENYAAGAFLAVRVQKYEF